MTTAICVPSASAATVISSSAYGVEADLNVLKLVTASLGPVGSVSGAAPAAYDTSKTVASVNQKLGLGLKGLLGTSETVKTGVITTTAKSAYPVTPTGSASATIAKLSTDLHTDLIGQTLDLLGLSATAISSSSAVSAFGSPLATGSSTIAGLALTGSVFKGFTFDANALAAAAPNTVLFNLAGLEIILNEQIHSGDGVSSAGIQTNAIDVKFSNFALGTNLLNGSLIVGHSQAAIMGFIAPSLPPGGVPEPAVWAELILGFGLAGSVLRRQRALALAA